MDTILITVDALRADHLGQYGYHRETMPILDDLLAEDANRYEQAFSNGTHTGISLPSMLTSRYLGDRPAMEGPTVADALPDGVTTVGVHSNTYFATRVGRPSGFDHFEDFDVTGSDEEEAVRSISHRVFRRTMDTVRPAVERLGVRDFAERIQRTIFPSRLIHESTAYETGERTTDRALEMAAEVDGDLFLWVHYMDPHRPFCMHIDDPAYSDKDLSSDEIHDLMSRTGVSPKSLSESDRELLRDLYDSELRYTSEQIRRLTDGLREQDRWEESQVIFTADHGEEFGEHGYYFHRNRPYDELIHVPLLVRGPETTGESVADQRELLDISPTICEAHNVEPPAEFLGQPLGEGSSRRVVATGSFSDTEPVVAGRWEGWKYIEAGEERELYDLDADPDEMSNVVDRYGDRVRAFRKEIPDRLREEDHSTVPTDTDQAVEDRLADLGYLE
ncbi:Arylsulfatase A [Haloplanus vescus]|uniref:Arylsulfatase A n=1 Tax=Haloplanus vescus TaxID=555874 RepID=A0A1H4AQS3_9EURY|nr:sulfatase-like hydrolase/transferase [Haloplanus vescus]SEA38107.1 Arylsulfatase A [Haloplanus vescus]